jgi:hypothetical protein
MLRLVVWLCLVLTLLLLVSVEDGRCTVSCEKLFTLVCFVSGVYFVLLFQRECVVSFTTSLDDVLMRKQIHAMNWRFVSNKAVALILLRDAYRKRRSKPREGGGGKCPVKRSESESALPCVRPAMDELYERVRSV